MTSWSAWRMVSRRPSQRPWPASRPPLARRGDRASGPARAHPAAQHEHDPQRDERDRPRVLADRREPLDMPGDRRAAHEHEEAAEDDLPTPAAALRGPDGRDEQEGDAEEQR